MLPYATKTSDFSKTSEFAKKHREYKCTTHIFVPNGILLLLVPNDILEGALRPSALRVVLMYGRQKNFTEKSHPQPKSIFQPTPDSSNLSDFANKYEEFRHTQPIVLSQMIFQYLPP